VLDIRLDETGLRIISSPPYREIIPNKERRVHIMTANEIRGICERQLVLMGEYSKSLPGPCIEVEIAHSLCEISEEIRLMSDFIMRAPGNDSTMYQK